MSRFIRRPRHLPPQLLELLSGTLVALAFRVLAIVLVFLFDLLVARRFGPARAGLLFLGMALVQLLSVVGRLGLDNVVVRHVAAFAAQNQWGRVLAIFRRAVAVVVPVSVVVGTLVWIAAPALANSIFHKPELSGVLRGLVFAVPFLALSFLHSEGLRGLKRIAYAEATRTVFPLAALTVVVSMSPALGVQGAVWGYVAGASIGLVLARVFWFKCTVTHRHEDGHFALDTLLRTALPLFATACMQASMRWAPIVILGLFSTGEAVGVYSVANRAAASLTMVLFAVSSIAAPQFAEAHTYGNRMHLAKRARNVHALVLLTGIPAVVTLALLRTVVLGLFGRDFVGGSDVLLILAAAELISIVAGPVGHLLIMTGHEVLFRNITATSTLITMLASALLVQLWGALGVAVAVAAGTMVHKMMALYAVRRRLGFWPVVLPRVLQGS